MADPKKKRTILMSEDPSEVSPPSLASRVSSFISDHHGIIRPRHGGVGGTLAKFDRKDAPKARLKWKVGFIKSEARNSVGKRKGKPKRGFQIELKF